MNHLPEHDFLDDRTVSSGVVEAIQLWSNDKYRRFLGRRRCKKLEEQWFIWFLGEWNIARTVKQDKKTKVLRFLNHEFGEILANYDCGEAIDRAANIVRRRGLTAEVGQNKIAGLPISMISKVAFLFYPAKYPPYDRLGKIGLNKLRGTKLDGGRGQSTFSSYKEYLDDFNRYFKQCNGRIQTELEESWPHELAEKIGVSGGCLGTRAFRRKVFDNVLMSIGRQ